MINFVVSDLETALVPNGEKMVQEETIELIMELKRLFCCGNRTQL